ncbi:MAG: phosphoenolpyruvate--protein phosphotransferase [Cardiobacteriaceae bacterium]|nr:phosphoenolpyruvate--protein phosphotransferase [Cardiobacteriaceae bacterium]
MKQYEGLAASSGIGIGKAWIFTPQNPVVDDTPATDPDAELAAFQAAQQRVDAHLEKLYERVLAEQGEDEAAIFESHRELLCDDELESDIKNRIRNEQQRATFAVKEALDAAAAAMRALDDDYLRERAAEFEDLRQNLLLALNDMPFASLGDAPPGSIVFARDLSPSETAQLDPAQIQGFVLEHGGLTSHVAILARNIGLPAVMGISNILETIESGADTIIDGDKGSLVVHPDAATLAATKRKQQAQIARKAEYAKLRDQRAITLDGRHFPLLTNIGSAKDLHLVDDNGAEGVGLFRSEFLFMENATAPSEERQYQEYRKVVEHLKGQPVILRLLDVGGDKPLPYLDTPEEENPFLGWRGIRLYAANLPIFLSQIRAALRACAHGDLWLMIPMIINVDELRWVKQHIAEQREIMQKEGIAVGEKLKVGVMIETPAAAIIARQLAKEADFFSIGSNDLTQYTLAVDRGNVQVAPLYDSLHPAVLSLMKKACDAAQSAGIDIGICGEMGSDLQATPLLIGMGFNEISISGRRLPAVKYALRHFPYQACRALLAEAITLDDAEAVRKRVAAFQRHYLPEDA